MKNLCLASTSTIYGTSYLEYLLPELTIFFKGKKNILFVPYARPGGISYENYTSIVKKAFATIKISVEGIHEFENPKTAISQATSIFVGGGNTFELVHQLYKNDLITVLKTSIEEGTPYLGTSAGSNICGVNMKTTNDMPIVYPPSFDVLGLIPFNINAHFISADTSSTHMGETRETRIKEFHVFNKTPVLGLREGSWLAVCDEKIVLKGNSSAILFQKGKTAIEIKTNQDISSIIHANFLQ